MGLIPKPRLEYYGLGRCLRSVGGHWEGADLSEEPSDSMADFFSLPGGSSRRAAISTIPVLTGFETLQSVNNIS